MQKRKGTKQRQARGTSSLGRAVKSRRPRERRKARKGPAGAPTGLAKLNARLAAQSAAIAMIAKSPAISLGQLDALFDLVAAAATETLSCACLRLWRFDEGQHALIVSHRYGDGGGLDPSDFSWSTAKQPALLDALDHGEDVLSDDAPSAGRTRELVDGYLRPMGIASFMATPIRTAGRLVGMLSVECTDPRRRWSLDERRFVRSMAYFIGATMEAAERERLRADAIEAKAAAETASQAKTDFLNSMSHELRTPLNAIIGFSEIMCEQAFGPLLPRYHEYVSDIHKSAAHLLTIINDVLDIARIESGKMTLYEGPVDLRALVDDSLAFVRERAAKKSIALEARVATDASPIRADDSRIRQIVLNLLSNAVKFTPEGGRVWIAVDHGTDGRVAVSVGDTGIGMKPEEIPRALEPFRQVDSMLARTQEGSGLGLPISKKLAALHGASFEIDSEAGRGTIVTMTFPKERTLGAHAPTDPSPAAAA